MNPDLAAPVHSDEAVPEDLYSRSSFRVTKRRTGNSRAHAPKQMPLGALGSNSHLTEDDLFQLLIGRIKQREENDIAATHARAKLEADVSELKKENKSLKDQVEVFGVQLQKRTLESRNYKAHISNWKERVGKFKKVLNGLGGDYQELCGESKHLKATAASLDKERKELAASLEIIKRDVSQASSAICEKRNHLSECQPIVGSLQSSLKSSEDKVESARIRLADERKRAAVLESYIQNHSIIQGKQVEVVRNDQLEMMDKMKFGFELIGKQWEFSQSNIHSGLKPMLDECLASIRSLGEKSSVDRVEIQQSTSTIQGLMSQYV